MIKMKYIILLTFVFLSFCLLSACGSIAANSSESSTGTNCNVSKTHPDSQYLTETAEAQTIEKARERATAELSRRLSAEIRSEVTVQTKQDDRGSIDDVQEKVKVSSYFKHAEIIKQIKKCTLCNGSTCQSTVALHRDELAQRLVQSINVDVKRLQEAAKDLQANTPLLRFTQAWYLAQAAHKRISPVLNKLKLIRRITPEIKEAESMMAKATQERAQREERLWVIIKKLDLVTQQKDSSLISDAIYGRLSKATETLGLKLWAQTDCPTGDEQKDVLTLQPKGSLSCNLGLVGPQCRLKVAINISLCQQGTLSEDNWSELKLVGVHTRETKGAVTKLIQSITQQDFSSVLAKSLSPFVILE